VRLRVHPRAAQAQVGGVHAGALCVRVTEPATEDRANRAVIRAVAKAFGVAASRVTIVSGDRSRTKRVEITGEPSTLFDTARKLAQTTR